MFFLYIPLINKEHVMKKWNFIKTSLAGFALLGGLLTGLLGCSMTINNRIGDPEFDPKGRLVIYNSSTTEKITGITIEKDKAVDKAVSRI
jgi:hypothetical protein